ncbi:hypothetical protein E2562_015013 [Oryza meyeriana var. granulata]|uniref:Uncharacterized protein n=1 Tax=Oryza meyeriana var. granulata TaxID=110450 RepID=A0A6G1ELQ6_9ORYZ|nr:hypothetical protein E2562_015013 [Oryza meyeriana var. granulata]
MVVDWLQQQNGEGQASNGSEDGQANIGSMNMATKNSSFKVPPTLQEQPYDSWPCLPCPIDVSLTHILQSLCFQHGNGHDSNKFQCH